MKTMRVFILFAILLLSGCSNKSVVSSTEVKDSVHVEYIPRMVEVKVPGEKVTVTKYIECDSVTNKPKPIDIAATKGKAHVAVVIDKEGQLTANSECDSLTELIKVLDQKITRLKSEKQTVVLPPEIVYKTYWFDVPARFISLLTLLIIIVYILRRLYFPNLLKRQ
jgi:uncharacterized protein YcfL